MQFAHRENETMNQTQLYHAASALADAIADACKDGAIDLALEQIDSLWMLVATHRDAPPPNVVRGITIRGEAA
jgi:hypothetical protein